jgi:hypothetical protein
LEFIVTVDAKICFAGSINAAESTEPLFPDLNLWDEEPESADDATIVIEKPVR